MPTENGSSNTEQMVSVPREHDLKICRTPLDDLLSGAKTGEIRDCSDREFAAGDTVLLREVDDARAYTGRTTRRTITHVQKYYGLPDHLCVLSYAQHQGEPVGEVWEDEHSVLAMLLPPGYSLPAGTKLYTHVDAAEVEQGYHNAAVEGLVNRQNELREERDTLRASLESVRTSRDAFAQNAIDLRAQLAERDALLRDINKRHSSGVDFDLPADLAARVTALSASAEPSAPKCEDCSGTGSPGGRMHANGIDSPEYEPYKCEKCDGFGIVGNILNAETCTDCTPSAQVELDERDERAKFDAWTVRKGRVVGYLGSREDFVIWQARAALERKP